MKKILVVYYSQSGQLERVARTIAAPLETAGDVEVHYEALRPIPEYPYPWPFIRFLDVFPESVYLDPPELAPLTSAEGARFDLIILAYTVWYLAPAPPITAFIQSDHGRALLKDTPVITVTACRNMWYMAQETIKQLLKEAGARLSDHIALIDQGGSFASFITTPRWMFTGKKNRLWGIFPAAGVADEGIDESARFGRAILKALQDDTLDGRRPVLEGLGAVHADERLIGSEKIGTRSFKIWGKLVRKMGKPGAATRVPILIIYVVFLILMIITVVPLGMTIRTLMRRLSRTRSREIRAYYEQPSGSDTSRINEFRP